MFFIVLFIIAMLLLKKKKGTNLKVQHSYVITELYYGAPKNITLQICSL